jgi:hypothetical protein
VFDPFRNMTDVDVVLSNKEDGSLVQFVEDQRGVQRIAALSEFSHYVLPRIGQPGEGRSAGTRVAVAAVRTSCHADALPLATDGDSSTAWTCDASTSEQTIDLDLGHEVMTGAVVDGIDRYADSYPRDFIVETSLDQTTWTPAWNGSLAGQTIRGGLDNPISIRIVIPYSPRMTRYIRLRHPPAENFSWVISELEVWSSNTGVPE